MDDSISLYKTIPWLSKLKPRKQVEKPLATSALSLNEEGFQLAQLESSSNSINFCATYQAPQENLSSLLKETVEAKALTNSACTWVLQPKDYQVFLLDALPIEPAEFQSAIRWHLKKQCPFPVETAVFDYFVIPKGSQPQSKDRWYVIASAANFLLPYIERIESSGLKLTGITVPELSYNAIAPLVNTPLQSSLFVYLQNQSAKITVVHQQQFYLSREVTFSEMKVETLALELQRTLDYFRTFWRIKATFKVFLAGLIPFSEKELETLNQNVDWKCEILDLAGRLQFTSPIAREVVHSCLPLIGSVLNQKGRVNANH